MAAVFITLSDQPGWLSRAAEPIRYQNLVDLLQLGGKQAVKDIVQKHVMTLPTPITHAGALWPDTLIPRTRQSR